MPDAVSSAVRTTCPYCGVGCGVVPAADGAGGWQARGDTEHPANFGRLCSKGSALGETLGLDGRLLHPMIEDRQVSWDEALAAVAAGFSRVIDRHGPDAVAFYVSGQLLSEDYYVANKLMKGFIGSANIDTNSRLCMASSVAGHKRAFGADVVPGCYADLDAADLIVLVGSNAAWCHPVLFQRMVRNRASRGARIVNIDPRRTATGEEADLQLSLRGGGDAILFSGLLVDLARRGRINKSYVDAHTEGFAEALATARALAPDAAATARACGLAIVDVERFFAWFAETERVVTCYSQGVNQSAGGTDKVNAIINCHLATGRIGREGAGPLSLTGQPNAMGGREVGGLANQLAAHMGFDPASIDRVRRFWRAPRMAVAEGFKAVEMFDAVADGRIKALWVIATNPVVSLPRADRVRAGLERLEMFVVSDNVARADTVVRAPIRLPACSWGEKDGTVTNSERRISRQRAFLPAPGEAKPDWWIVCEVAKRLGHAHAFDFPSTAEIFAEHAALSAFENAGSRAFDLGALADLSPAEYDGLFPVQWPVRRNLTAAEPSRFFATGGFFTTSGKGRFVGVGAPAEVGEAGTTTTDSAFPLRLNTGRIRDQWHTMTRSGKSPRLAQHLCEPYVEISTDDASRLCLSEGRLARVRSAHGEAVLRIVVSEGQRPGTIFVPIHWSDENSSSGRIGAVVHGTTDPISGQPDSKATPCRIEPCEFAFSGYVLARQQISMPAPFWVQIRLGAGWLYKVAFDAEPRPSWPEWTARLFSAEPAHLLTLSDPQNASYRAAYLRNGDLIGCLFVAARAPLPAWDWLAGLLGQSALDDVSRRALLAGRTTSGAVDQGPLVCACFAVGRNQIASAVAVDGCSSVDAIGAVLRAGTNCGSCIPELRKIIASEGVCDAA
ncbi:MAG: molybdopterin-dependent oxidoreductase [Rhodospirillales bacterium]|nr:molybdopterin-dependent oxidoreductase [Rhodospirillales bacterium]